MFRVERVAGAAITLTVLWITAVVFAIMHSGQPPAGAIVLILTLAMCTAWFFVWAIPMAQRVKELQATIDRLQIDQDVDLAMEKLRPQLRVVHYDR